MLSSFIAAYDPSYDQAAVAALAAAFGTYGIVILIVSILVIVAQWKIFTKAGEHGWASIIPFYNNYVLFKIAMGNGWLFLLCLVPVVNFVILIVCMFKLAKAFGKGVGFGFGLWLLGPIFMMILGFGSAEYVGVE